MIQRLQLLELIKENGRLDAPGRPILYVTTDKFLDYFGLESLDQLPELDEEKQEDEEMDLMTLFEQTTGSTEDEGGRIMAERLQKVMANAGVASRRASEKLIQEGRVMVNGVVVTELGTKVESDDSISVDGKLLKKDEKKVYYLLYKPRGVISAAKDNKGREVVTDYLKDVSERLYPVGRLDYDTSGLLILTNDGDFANQMMHPRYKVDKTYVAKVEGLITPDSIKKLRNGVVIDGKPTSRARAKIISRDAKKNTSIVSLTIHEGRYHQVKKMFDAVGHKVQKLSRTTYGTLTLDGLTSGEYRELSHNEVRELLKLINNK